MTDVSSPLVQEGRTLPTKKVVINACFGGFGLSDAAYEKLIEWGVPVRKYTDEQRGDDGRYVTPPENVGEIIFDRELTPPEANSFSAIYHQHKRESRVQTRYWDTWTDKAREHPLIVRVVEEFGKKANGFAADLRIVEIPAGVEYEISEYDGNEHIAETHRTWYASSAKSAVSSPDFSEVQGEGRNR